MLALTLMQDPIRFDPAPSRDPTRSSAAEACTDFPTPRPRIWVALSPACTMRSCPVPGPQYPQTLLRPIRLGAVVCAFCCCVVCRLALLAYELSFVAPGRNKSGEMVLCRKAWSCVSEGDTACWIIRLPRAYVFDYFGGPGE